MTVVLGDICHLFLQMLTYEIFNTFLGMWSYVLNLDVVLILSRLEASLILHTPGFLNKTEKSFSNNDDLK